MEELAILPVDARVSPYKLHRSINLDHHHWNKTRHVTQYWFHICSSAGNSPFILTSCSLPPPKNNKNTLDEQWHNLIRFILCLAEYIRHCSAHWSWTEPLGERLLSHINQMDSRLVKSLSVFTCGDRKHCTRLHTVHRYLQVTHVCAYMSATHTRTSERGSTHPVRHTRITLCRWRTGFTWSDGAFSTGLELTDAQADYSAFSGHMTRGPACKAAAVGQVVECSALQTKSKVVTITGRRFDVPPVPPALIFFCSALFLNMHFVLLPHYISKGEYKTLCIFNIQNC